MKSVVRFLNIEKEKVDERCYPFNDLGRTVAAGLNAGVNTLRLGFFKKCRRKVGLSKRLAARNGKSTTRIFVKGFVAKHLVHDLVGAYTSAYLLDRRSRASGGALSAGKTAASVINVDGRAVFGVTGEIETVFALLAGICASSAVKAFMSVKRNVYSAFLRLGVVTPKTAQRTALDEYGGTYSGSVMHAEALDIEYVSLYV